MNREQYLDLLRPMVEASGAAAAGAQLRDVFLVEATPDDLTVAWHIRDPETDKKTQSVSTLKVKVPW